ncbi:MAG: hypothetical protein JRN21_05115 [Nitrososphaerota archaeon]|nr:hypothetical protein [Nitrososphaerota archaeon]
MASFKKAIKALYGSKLGKILPVLIITGLVATASASVFVIYYGSATATVATPDVKFAVGFDASSASSYHPTVTLSPTNDFATIGITFFPSATESPQPSIYYTDLLNVTNAGSSAHNIVSFSISNIVDASSSLGVIDVYYCPTQTNAPTSSNCELYAITSTTPPTGTGAVTFPYSLTASTSNYIEVVAHAASGATAANTVTFDLQVSWA